MIVYKHAITTISPNKPILFTDGKNMIIKMKVNLSS